MPNSSLLIPQTPPTCTELNCGEGGGDLTRFTNFVTYELPNFSGIALIVPWVDVDNCAANGYGSGPCLPDNNATCASNPNYCYNWAGANGPDITLMSYINATVGTGSNTFDNGCFGGRPCTITLLPELEQDAGLSVTLTPNYVMSASYAASLGVAPQDVAFCKQWPGATTSWWPGPVPLNGSFTEGTQGVVMNVSGACAAYGGGPTCGSGANAPAANNLSGFPVVYEVPRLTAARAWIAAIAQHYSPTGLGYGPKIYNYLKNGYIRIPMAEGDEDSPGCTMSDSGSPFFWPGPKGLAAEPQGFTQTCYLTSCGADGDGYVDSQYAYYSGLNWNGIRLDSASHKGPPANGNYTYANVEAQLANQYGIGFGMQAASTIDISAAASGDSCPGQPPNPTGIGCTGDNWVSNFRRYPNVPHHLQMAADGGPNSLVADADGGANPLAAVFPIINITVVGSGPGNATISCTDNNTGTNNKCAIFADQAVWLTGTQNGLFDGLQMIICGPLSALPCPSTTQISFTTTAAPGTYAGGEVWTQNYWPVLLPFISQQPNIMAVEFHPCDGDYAWGDYLNFTERSGSCQGNTGPDASYQQSVTTFLTVPAPAP